MNKTNYQEYNLFHSKDEDNQMSHWLNRALFVLSFKDAHTQNLRFITKVLGITTTDERNDYIKELLKMIQRGIIYVPKGLPYLIERKAKFNLDNPVDLESIEISLLHPFKQLISKLQSELPLNTTEAKTITADVH